MERRARALYATSPSTEGLLIVARTRGVSWLRGVRLAFPTDGQWHLEPDVCSPRYSGGTAPESHRLP
jgi:hypothetical protein